MCSPVTRAGRAAMDDAGAAGFQLEAFQHWVDFPAVFEPVPGGQNLSAQEIYSGVFRLSLVCQVGGTDEVNVYTTESYLLSAANDPLLLLASAAHVRLLRSPPSATLRTIFNIWMRERRDLSCGRDQLAQFMNASHSQITQRSTSRSVLATRLRALLGGGMSFPSDSSHHWTRFQFLPAHNVPILQRRKFWVQKSKARLEAKTHKRVVIEFNRQRAVVLIVHESYL